MNFSHLTTADYADMYDVIKKVKEDGFQDLHLDACLLEDELNKVFILFMYNMTPKSVLWNGEQTCIIEVHIMFGPHSSCFCYVVYVCNIETYRNWIWVTLVSSPTSWFK